jgi:hypothetical protein
MFKFHKTQIFEKQIMNELTSSIGASNKDTGFGAFQSSDKDAWSMGQGIVNFQNIKKKEDPPKPQSQNMGLFAKSTQQ